MSELFFPIPETKQLFLNAIPDDVFTITVPSLGYLYIPDAHTKALHPNNMLVEGMRGAGKSFWWAALQNETNRKLIQLSYPHAGLAKTDCIAGFGGDPSPNYPSSKMLQQLQTELDANLIWYGVIAWNLLHTELDMPETWGERIIWIKNNFDVVEKRLLQKDGELYAQQKTQLILFDALDRAAQDWKALRKLLKGLLSLLLDFRFYKAIRLKAFIRPDMLEDNSIFAFPDSSKVIQNKVSLDWSKLNLYSLLWQYLGNEPTYGESFRRHCAQYFAQVWENKSLDNTIIWQIPKNMKTDEQLQRKIFHALAGEYMGNNAKRGFPYTWLPNHLGDSYGKVSPRSFLAALRTAVADELRKDQKYPLHYESIKRGVQAASSIRVNELKEDYPWVTEYLTPLKGLSLPCEFSAIAGIWSLKQQPTLIPTTNEDNDARRYSARFDKGISGIKQDLIDLGIFQEMRDGRINMPDVYRIGHGLGRKGGIKPVR